MATPPESTKYSPHHRLAVRARQRWPQIADVDVRFRGAFAYVEAHLADGTVQPLVRLRYGGSAQHWGFGLYQASNDRYEDPPHGVPMLRRAGDAGSPGRSAAGATAPGDGGRGALTLCSAGHDLTAGWTVPLTVFAVVVVARAVFGGLPGRDRHV